MGKRVNSHMVFFLMYPKDTELITAHYCLIMVILGPTNLQLKKYYSARKKSFYRENFEVLQQPEVNFALYYSHVAFLN